jgi:integrase
MLFKPKGSANFHTQIYAHGRAVRQTTGTADEKKALKILRQRAGAVANGILPDTRSLRYEDMEESYYADYKIHARKSLRFDKNGNPRLDKVVRLAAYFAGFRASEIGTEDVRKFIIGEQARHLAPASINRSCGALKRMLRLAVRDGRLRAVPYIPMLRESPPRSGFFERADFDRLSQSLPDHLRLPLALGFFTAMRREEVLSLQWEQVDFLSGVIPLVPELHTLLVAQHARREPGCVYVCFRLDRKGHAARIGNFRKVWQSRCVKLGLGKVVAVTDPTGEPLFEKPRGPRSKPKAKMVYQGMIFHDLRRSGVRNLIRAGVPEKTARQISGHKTRSIFDRYNIVSEDDVADAGRKLAAFHEITKVSDSSVAVEAKKQQEILQ